MSDKGKVVAVMKRAHKSNGKLHPLYVGSLENLAHDIQRASTDVILNDKSNSECFTILSNILIKESMRVREILR